MISMMRKQPYSSFKFGSKLMGFCLLKYDAGEVTTLLLEPGFAEYKIQGYEKKMNSIEAHPSKLKNFTRGT
ncbi:hypothetical protein LINPERHAP2_LOCUS44693, partial [Linum perenne]